MAPASTNATNTLSVLALVGAEIVFLITYVGSCELWAKDSAGCENRWAMALPAMALAGQSVATYFIDSDGIQIKSASGRGVASPPAAPCSWEPSSPAPCPAPMGMTPTS